MTDTLLPTIDAVATQVHAHVSRLSSEMTIDAAEQIVFDVLASVLFGVSFSVRRHESIIFSLDLDALKREVTQAASIDVLSAVCERYLAGYRTHDRHWLGAFYTPAPLARFLVHSVDALLHSIDLDGIADPGVRVIDPACGSGNLLTEAASFAPSGGVSAEKFHGVERISCAAHVCNLRMRALCSGCDDAVSACCRTGNAMESLVFANVSGPLAILCGPPFNQYSTDVLPEGNGAAAVYRRYVAPCIERGLDANAHTDAYIKFIALCHDLLVRSDSGVIGLVVRHAWLASHAHAGMRVAMMQDFDEIFVVDLHGDPHDRFHGNRRDENVYRDMVYDVGVCVLFLVRRQGKGCREIKRFDLFGDRPEKWDWLMNHTPNSISWNTVIPAEPWCAFA